MILQTIKFPQFNFPGFECKECSDLHIEFYDSHLRVHSSGEHNLYNEDMQGLEVDVVFDVDNILFKEFFTGLCSFYDNSKKCYAVEIQGMSEDIIVLFPEDQKKEMIEFKSKLMKWKAGSLPPIKE